MVCASVKIPFHAPRQMYPGCLLRVRIGVQKDLCAFVPCVPLNRFDIALAELEFIGGTAVADPVKDHRRERIVLLRST